jgi:hypothetical protein
LREAGKEAILRAYFRRGFESSPDSRDVLSMKVKLVIYGFKPWLGPIGMNSIVDTIEGEVTPEKLGQIKKLMKAAEE